MATNKINTTGNLESRVITLEARITALEQLSKKFNRKQRVYTPEQKAAIRARLLAGQEMALKKKETQAKAIVKPASNIDKPKQIVKAVTVNKKIEPVPPPKQS